MVYNLPKLKRMFSFRQPTSQALLEHEQGDKLRALFTPGFSCALNTLWNLSLRSLDVHHIYISELFLLKKCKGTENRHYLVATVKWPMPDGKTRTKHWCVSGEDGPGYLHLRNPGYIVRTIDRPFDSLSDRVVACFRFPTPNQASVSNPLHLHDLLAIGHALATSDLITSLLSAHHELTGILLQLILERCNVAPSRKSFTFTSGPSVTFPPRRNVLRKVLRSYYWQICIGLPKNLGIAEIPKDEMGVLMSAVEEAVHLVNREGYQRHGPRLEAVRYERVSLGNAGVKRLEMQLDDMAFDAEATVCEHEEGAVQKVPLKEACA
ncbi:hypothetical protein BDQ17DRAFT_1375801 [Cyathus striatus]|nr:hypothetical protein BDQ17DRAFT_1375801 [Cyathus striatus]